MKNLQVVFSEDTNTHKERRRNYGQKLRTVTDEIINKIIDNAYKKGRDDAKKEQKRNSKLVKEGREEGIKEQAKEAAKQEKKVEEKLEQLSARGEISLLSINTLFPFDPFPNTLQIDTTKITLILRDFFYTERVITISFKDILDVIFEKSLFLANLTITYLPKSEGMGMIQPKTCKIQLLRCEEARKAKNILKGMLLARREDVDVTQIKPEELRTMIERFGESDAET